MTTASKVETALKSRNLRHLFTAIENNGGTKGEVVLWPFGKPVYSCREAVAYAEKVKAGEEAAYAE